MKRFYKDVSIEETFSGFSVNLDNRLIRTPKRNIVEVTNRKLACILAEEWRIQREDIDLSSMHANKIINSAIDNDEEKTLNLKQNILNYFANDMLCYRVDEPQELMMRQNELWDPILETIRSNLRISFNLTNGILNKQQPVSTLNKLRNLIYNLPPLALVVIHNITCLTGSAIIALALFNSLLEPLDAWNAANLEEIWQQEKWGIDVEAEEVMNKRYIEFQTSYDVLSAIC